MGDQPLERPLPTQGKSRVGFGTTNTVFEGAKVFRALDSAAIVIGNNNNHTNRKVKLSL
jgi:hypothetical protein